jgi:hypothetical protein
VFDEETEAECNATADGIVHCLQMLAQEAADLNLPRTLAAIQRALQICHDEGIEAPPLAYEMAEISATIH